MKYKLKVIAISIIITIILAILIFCFLVGAFFFALPKNTDEFEISSAEWISPLSREPIEQQGHFKIPTSAQDIKIYVEDSLNDRFIYASFKIHSSELESFLATTSIGNLTISRPPPMFDILPHELKWDIDSKKEYLSGEENLVNRQGIVLDNDAEGEYIVYLVVFLL